MEETEASLLVRVKNIHNLLKLYSDKKILLVGHANFFWYLTGEIVEGERFGTWLNNCELFEYDPYSYEITI